MTTDNEQEFSTPLRTIMCAQVEGKKAFAIDRAIRVAHRLEGPWEVLCQTNAQSGG